MQKTSAIVKFAFLVLHYMAYEMTVECIDNLLQHYGDEDVVIAVVDNASPNGSGRQLERRYKNDNRVVVLVNSCNEGFARGNNRGYRYLKEVYRPEYMIVMNNDVLIDQANFLNEIEKIYYDTDFSVLGPDIYCPLARKHQNPAHLNGFHKRDAQRLYNTTIKYCEHPAFYFYKRATLGRLKRKIIKGSQNIDLIDRTVEMENVVLHGACYIFSANFIQQRTDCFCPKTFLYMEEDILHYECVRDGMRVLYSPRVKVNHLEDVSTNASIESEYQKFKMKNQEMKKSIEVFLEILDETE